MKSPTDLEWMRGIYPEDLTWTCHICGEERPDDKIGVINRQIIIIPDVIGHENIRFCKDKESCREGALTFSHLNPKSETN